jgi:acyl phosphate:glycerol-3-phosphate acyltransferase
VLIGPVLLALALGYGNIGATNVLRTGRKGLAVATLLADMFKGTAAVWIALRWGPEPALAAALGAFLGHVFPVWLRFQGGKGVATFLGCLLGFSLWAALAFAAVWLCVAALTKYSSLSALIASATSPLLLWFLGQGRIAVLFGVLAVLVWLKHRQNIRRLLDGTEGRIGRTG